MAVSVQTQSERRKSSVRRAGVGTVTAVMLFMPGLGSAGGWHVTLPELLSLVSPFMTTPVCCSLWCTGWTETKRHERLAVFMAHLDVFVDAHDETL
jgi:hypothetical protein